MTKRLVLFHKFLYFQRLIYLIIFSLFFVPFFSNAKSFPLRFTHINEEGGLSQNAIVSILQDREGFIWIGTMDGLNLFDGYRFTVYKHKPTNENSLSNNFISALFEDSEGVLWIGTRGGGLNRFDRKRNHIVRYMYRKNDSNSLAHNSVRTIYEDRSGRLWIGTEGGLCRLDRRNQRFTVYTHDPDNPRSLSHNFVKSIIEDFSGNLWVGTYGGGLNRFDVKKSTFNSFRHRKADENSLSEDRVWTLFEDSSKRLWIGTFGGGLNLFNPESGTFQHYLNRFKGDIPISRNIIFAINEDAEGRLWVGSFGGGLTILDPENANSRSILHSSDKSDGLNSNQIFNIFVDRSNLIWIGTTEGLNLYDPEQAKFKLFRQDVKNPKSLSHNFVMGIAGTSTDNIWIGTLGGGLNHFNWKQGTFTHYRARNSETRGGLSSDFVSTVCIDHKSTVWIGTYNGLNSYQPDSASFRYYGDSGPGKESISAIFEDSGHRLWIGTYSGLFELDSSRVSFNHYRNIKSEPSSLSSNRILTVNEDTEKRLWIGTDGGGLCLFDPVSSTFRSYVYNAQRRSSISYNAVTTVFEDSRGLLWVGTRGGGLNRFDTDQERFVRYGVKDGLPSEVIYGILEDGQGQLWLSTVKGICRFRPLEKRFDIFDKSDGLQGNEFNTGSFYKDKRGRLYFGGAKGLTVFDPNEITENRSVSPVVLTDFLLFNNRVDVGENQEDRFALNKPIRYMKEIVLNYSDYIFSFEFSMLNYRQSEKNRFKYKLEGLDKVWIETDSLHRRATYTNLTHGDYLFTVIASNDDGFWNREGTAVRVKILPPFWKTPWAYIFYSFVLIAIVTRFILVHQRKLAQKQRELNREKEFSLELEEQVRIRTEEVVKQKEQLELQANQLYSSNKELEKLSIVASETDNAVFIMGPDGSIEWVNIGFTNMYGITLDMLKTEGIRSIFKLSMNPRIQHFMDKCMENKESVIYETQIVREKGNLIWIQTNLTPIIDEVGNVRKLVGIDTDISKIKTAEALAEKANRSKSEFLARMSHEIRTPMNGVIGFTDILLDSELSVEQVDYARMIKRSGESLIILLNDILDFSKIEAGELIFDPIDFDPEITAFDICDLIVPRVNSKSVEVLCRIGDNVPAYIHTDPGRFRQIIVNLMGNASKFTEKGEIELSLKVVEESVDQIKLHVTVMDTGIGIAEEKLTDIFDAFQQADGSTTRRFGGTGLGLAICKQLVEMMDGEIWVESVIGKGSRFHFTCWVGRSKKRPKQEIKIDGLKGKRIFVVDDNVHNLEILSKILTKLGVDVTTFDSPETVISDLQTMDRRGAHFDLGIVDVQMPGISGFELAEMIRAEKPPISELPLLAFSSSTLFRAKVFRDSGFNGFLPKPIGRKKLIKIIEHLILPGEDKDSEISSDVITQYSIVESAKTSIRILLVEDNPINIKLSRHLLENAGYSVSVAENGSEAVELYLQNPNSFDLILMDIQMPVMDGMEATKRIRGAGYGDIPIIAMTAGAMKGDREKCLESGMNDYISKPVKREIVFKLIKKWCLEDTEEDI